MKDGFYGAPTVVAVFAQGNFLFKTADAFCMMENMVLQATELGIAFCIISRLGYIDGEQPQSKPRKPGRVKIIE